MGNFSGFRIIISVLCSFYAAILIDYLIRFRPSLSEKYVLKLDFQRLSDQSNTENREAHKLIFQKLDEINKAQNLILIELGKKADRKEL